MATKIIVSYDGTDNDRDALALGQLLAGANTTVELAYVRHAHEVESGRERLAVNDAEALLTAGAAALGLPNVHTHVVVSASTAEGLRALATSEHADVVVFGSEYRTAPGHVSPQPSAGRLLEGGPVAVAIAPASFADRGEHAMHTIAAIGEEGDPCTLETAQSLATRFGATITTHASGEVDFMVVGSKPGVVNGRVTISAAAEYLIELTPCPVLVLPRGVGVSFDG